MTQLTYRVRELIWSVESELAVLADLAHRIDEQVRAVNACRAELAARLLHLDQLLEVAPDEPHLASFLAERARVRLPSVPSLRAADQPP